MTTTTQLTTEQVEQMAKTLAPDVVRIRFNPGQDWDGSPAIFFRVLLSDEVSYSDRLSEVASRVAGQIFDGLGLAEVEATPHFKFRSVKEQAKLKDPAWD